MLLVVGVAARESHQLQVDSGEFARLVRKLGRRRVDGAADHSHVGRRAAGGRVRRRERRVGDAMS